MRQSKHKHLLAPVRPRFSLRTLLIGMTLAGVSTWWVSWPPRTLSEFVELVRVDPEAAADMTVAVAGKKEFLASLVGKESMVRLGATVSVTTQQRSAVDMLLGRQPFSASVVLKTEQRTGKYLDETSNTWRPLIATQTDSTTYHWLVARYGKIAVNPSWRRLNSVAGSKNPPKSGWILLWDRIVSNVRRP